MTTYAYPRPSSASITTIAPEQLRLDLSPLVEPIYEPEMTPAERFAAFHQANPRVAEAIEAMCRQWLARHPKVGIKAVFENLRWQSGLTTVGGSWRLDNTFTAYYARLMLDRHPEWQGRIETRSLASERT